MKRLIIAIVLLLSGGGINAADTTAQVPSNAVPADQTGTFDSVLPGSRTTPETLTDSTALADTSGAKSHKKKSSLDTLRYDATVIFYDLPDKTLYLKGNAVARYQNLILYADTIIYHINESLFEAHGKPLLVDGSDTTAGEYMTYNIKTKRGRVQYATTRVDQAFFDGHRIVKSPENHLYIEQGDYTTCAYPDHPHYYFYAKNIKVMPGDKTISRPVVLNIGEVPIAALPYFIMPLNNNRRSGWLMPTWGGQPTSGGYLDNVGYYWAPNDFIDLKLASKIQEFTTYVLNAQSNYALRYWFSGGINARYSLGNGYSQSTGQVTQGRNWAIDYSHSQQLLPDGSFTLAGSGSLVSSSNFYRNYSEDTTELLNKSQSIHANMALTKRFSAINASAQMVWNRNQDMISQHLTEDIPSVSFNLPGRPLFPYKVPENLAPGATGEPKWFNNISYSYNGRGVMKRDTFMKDTLMPGFTRPGLEQGLSVSMPTRIFKYFTVNPSFSTRLSTFYGYMDTTVKRIDTTYALVKDTLFSLTNDTNTRHRTYTPLDTTVLPLIDSTNYQTAIYDTLYVIRKKGPPQPHNSYDTTWDDFRSDYGWNAGVSLSTRMYGMFPLKVLGLTGIRHTISPSVSYTFFPEHKQAWRYFPIGISAGGARKQGQVAGISIDNLFEGKVFKPGTKAGEKPAETKFTILTLGLSTSYDFEKDSLNWSNLGLNAGTSVSFVRVAFSADYWLYDERALSFPLLHSYQVSVSPNNFAVSGSFWDGDFKVLDKAEPDDPVGYAGAGPQSWQINLSPSYRFDASRTSPRDLFVTSRRYSLGASASMNFTRNWGMSWSSTYDFTHNQFINHTLNFRCDLECWDLRFDWRPSGINPGYYFIVNIKKIPDIKWEIRD